MAELIPTSDLSRNVESVAKTSSNISKINLFTKYTVINLYGNTADASVKRLTADFFKPNAVNQLNVSTVKTYNVMYQLTARVTNSINLEDTLYMSGIIDLCVNVDTGDLMILECDKFKNNGLNTLGWVLSYGIDLINGILYFEVIGNIKTRINWHLNATVLKTS